MRSISQVSVIAQCVITEKWAFRGERYFVVCAESSQILKTMAVDASQDNECMDKNDNVYKPGWKCVARLMCLREDL